jgi:tetratricopeptide (TPR) repeat protein
MDSWGVDQYAVWQVGAGITVREDSEQNNLEDQQPPNEEPAAANEAAPKDEAISDEEKAALSADALSADPGEEPEQAEVAEVPADAVEIEPSPTGGGEEALPEDLSATEKTPDEPADTQPAPSTEEQEFFASPDEDLQQAEAPGDTAEEEVGEEEEAGEAAAEDVEEPAAGEVPKRRFAIPLPSRKTTTSVAAGLLAGILVAGWLTAHRTRQLKDLAEIVESGGGLLTPLDRAKNLMEENEYASARDLLQRFVDATPQSAERSEGLFLLGESIQAFQEEHPTEIGYTEARERYRKAMDADPSSPRVPRALRNIAETYLAEEMYEEARKSLEELVRKYPDLTDIADVEFNIADTYFMQKDSSAATRKLRAVIADYPDSHVVPQAKLLLARTFQLEREFDRASKLYEDVLSAFPQDELGAEAQERLGDVAFERSDYAEAVALYKKRVEMPVAVKDNDLVLLKLARSQAAAGDWRGCAGTCRTMLNVVEESELQPEMVAQLCRAEQEQGRIDAAIQYAYEGHAKFPKNALLVKNLAGLYYDKGEYAEAAHLYDEAVQLASDDPQAWFRGGAAHFEAGDLESSHRNLRELTKRFPSDELAYDAYLKLADIYHQRGDPERAIDLLSSRLDDHVVSASRRPILSKIAAIYLDLGLPGQAADTYAKMLDGVDDNEVFARMGIACLQAERWDSGLSAIREVDRSRVTEDLAYDMFVEMGVALRSFGNLPGAMEGLETAVTEYPARRDERGVTALLRTYLAANKVTDAEKLVETVERWASRDVTRGVLMAQVRLIWGDSLTSRGNHAAALEQFTKIASEEDLPDSIKEWATYQKGNSYLQLSRYGDSAAAYEQFLTSYPSSLWKKAAQTKLNLAKLEVKLRDREI